MNTLRKTLITYLKKNLEEELIVQFDCPELADDILELFIQRINQEMLKHEKDTDHFGSHAVYAVTVLKHLRRSIAKERRRIKKNDLS